MKTFMIALSLFLCFKTVADDRLIVSGTGKVNVTPNAAICRFGVETTHREAIEAQKENSKIMTEALEGIKSRFKIAESDIVTSHFRVNAEYDYQNSKRTFRGYRVDNGVQVRLRDAKRLGEFLDFLTKSGVQQIDSVTFTHNDYDKLKKEALRLSIADAREKAGFLAEEAKRKLGKIETIVEEGILNNPPIGPLERGGPHTKMALASGAATPIQSGELEITSSVQVSFELK